MSSKYLSILNELISVPSFVGTDSHLLVLLKDKLEKLDFEVTVKNSTPEFWNLDTQGSPPLFAEFENPKFLVAYPPKERDSGLLLFAHNDTEKLSADNQKLMQFSDGESKYFGHGIADDKAGVAVILLAVESLSKNPEVKLPAIVFAHAKHGGCYGMSEAISSLKNRTGAIYCHPAESNQGFTQIKVASRGIATFSLKLVGELPIESEENTPASADPRLGRSAITLSTMFISEVNNWADPDIVWLVSEISSKGKDYRVPELCEFRISVWFRNLTLDEIETTLKARFFTFGSQHGISDDLLPQISGIRANPAVTANEGFVEIVKSAITRHTGESVSEYDWHAASDIRFPLLHLGIPAVGFGCLAGGFYGGDEWVDKTSFHQFVEIVTDLTENYAS
jgi:acetylornithine deacetylase/succinyl-diaminopimelate desuccinylase-like protein